jgi:hypothetical protein
MAYETPNYIKALLKPNGSKPAGRRAWGIDLESVWLPAFTAMNAMNETRIPHEALGAPLRLAYNTDGTVKFSKTGRPVVKVVKEIADSVKLIRENLVAGLIAHAHSVATEFPDEYKDEAMANQEAGRPIVERDRNALTEAVIAAAEAAADKVLAALE